MLLFIEEKYIILEERTAGTIGTLHFLTLINLFHFVLCITNQNVAYSDTFWLSRQTLRHVRNERLYSYQVYIF
jgi:hypothetical protein